MPRELDQQLTQAVKQNSLPQVEALLAAGARPGKSLLKQVHPRRDDIRAALVLGGADGTELGLLWAVSTGRPEVVDRLLAQGATNGLALLHACGLGSLAIVDRLLAAGADPDAGNTVATPLLNALKSRHEAVARRLLAAGANPSHTPQFVPCTPVFQAVASNLPELLEALLAAGGDTSRTFPHATVEEAPVETPPVVLAARLGHAACLRALLAAGADPEARDGKGRTAFEVAEGEPILEVLASFGIRGVQRRPEEELLQAAEQGDLPALDRALAAGAPVDARDRRDLTRGCTALHLAAAQGHRAAVERLLAAGANPALTDLEGKKHPYLSYLYGEGGEAGVQAAGERLGRTPLMLAARAGHVKVCEAFSGEVDTRDGVGMTALLLAAERGHREVVELLLARGANRSHRGPGKCTAFSLASEGGHPELAALLAVEPGKKKNQPPRATPRSKARRPVMAPVPDLSAFAGFSALVDELAERCGNKPVALGVGVRCAVRVARRRQFDFQALRASLGERGALLFELEPGEVALLPTADPLEAVAFMQTNGANDGIGSGDILEFLRGLEVPWRLKSLRHDLLEVELLEPVADPKKLARRCRELCPDLEPQEPLRQIEQGRLYFWWD